MSSEAETDEDKWAEFRDPASYTITNLGRPAKFLIPTKKLKVKKDRVELKDRLGYWLAENFGAYTYNSKKSFGLWVNGLELVYDKCREYKVSPSSARIAYRSS